MTKTFSARDIATAINNALALASRPSDGEIGEARLRRLSEYALAVTAPCKEHVEQGLLSPPELVVVLLSCGLLVQAESAGEDRLPMVSLAKKLKKGKQ